MILDLTIEQFDALASVIADMMTIERQRAENLKLPLSSEDINFAGYACVRWKNLGNVLDNAGSKSMAHGARGLADDILELVLDSIPDVTISKDDSYNCGNCSDETERVAATFGGRPTNAREVARRFPEKAVYILSTARYVVEEAKFEEKSSRDVFTDSEDES